MAKPKKGQLAQFMVPMVDATDFNSVESAITASDFNSGATVKFYGLDQGTSTATTSGTVSKIASLVRSGVFRITLKTTENNYDLMQLRVNKTGCAEQIIVWENVDNDDSDVMSRLVVIASAASDAASAALQGNSRILLVQSRLSDLDSRLASDTSDILSAATAGASRALLIQSRLSDLDSRLASDVSDIYSQLLLATSAASDAHSAANVGNSRILLVQSRLSDFDSRIVSDISDLRSYLSDIHSDLKSAIGGITVSLDASNISDIASAVVAALPITSMVSDIYSLLSDLNSNFHSRIPKEPSARSQVSDLDSDLLSYLTGISGAVSDAHSAANVGNSRALLIQSRLSDLDSRLVSDLSDVYSAAVQTNSRVLLNQSRISDVQSYLAVMSGVLSDAYSLLAAGPEIGASSMSDIRSAITATELDASDLSDIASAVWARAGAEPAAVFSHSGTMGAKVDWLAAMSRNKVTQTATVLSLRNDADNADIASAAVSDDGTTYTRGEFA